jgi:3-methyladenine DNA glycosylase AlkD
MNKTQVMDLLKSNTNDRGVENWNKLDISKNLKSFGVGLTVLRKLAKKIGRDHALAAQLWKSKNYDAKIIALLIDDPKKITREQAEKQVDELEGGYLAHVFSS